MQTHNKQNIVLVLIIALLFLTAVLARLLDPYGGNTWGARFKVKYSVRGSFYLDSLSEISVYSLPDRANLYCSEKNKNDRLFCWYDTLLLKEPVSGWVNVDNIYKE